MSESKFKLKISEDDSDVAYLSLPDHPGSGISGVVAKQISLGEIIKGYKGADVHFDFDKDGKLIGIEILA